MPRWSAYVEYDAKNLPDGVHEHIVNLLMDHDAVPSTAPNGQFSVFLDVEAPTAELAVTEALRVTGDALRHVYGNCPVVGIEIMTTAERERRNTAPIPVPELVGNAEAAEILGAKPQRVGQLAQTALFQRHVQTVAQLASGPVYLAAQIRQFNEVRQRTPGRPRKTA